SAESLARFWPALRVLRLGQSFRASQRVLDSARALLESQGRCGPLTAARPLAAELRLFAAPDARAEARWVAARARELIGATAHSLLDAAGARGAQGELAGSLAPGDIAVLVRVQAQIPPLVAALEAAGVPCVAPAAGEFWRDELCGRFLAATEERWRVAREENTVLPPPQELLARVGVTGENVNAGETEALGHSQPWRELCRLWAQCESWQAFFERLAWLHEAELVSGRAERVRILTLHASKGLEFQAVFLPGLERGLLPLDRGLLFGASAEAAPADLEEERRLLYVGLTRAARGIFASHAASRSLYGRTLELAPSPFLDTIRAFYRQSILTRHVRRNEEPLSLL
ncbi:MAG: ATP-dependent helicase, partial [Desulfovibrio sp.]|nr:ATP-dependent helicase [Desulfovibrio sp.]